MLLLIIAATMITSGYTNGTGQIWRNFIRCAGYETKLVDCYYDDHVTRRYTCTHANDVGVSCTGTTCPQGALRLRDGDGTYGRLEICNNNAWGALCAAVWDRQHGAEVACRQLGLQSDGTYNNIIKDVFFILLLLW